MITVAMNLPDEMQMFATPKNKEEELLRNAMILYPYILNKKISHGRASEILGIPKWNLIDLYGQLGICYFDQIKDELDKDLETFKQLNLDGGFI